MWSDERRHRTHSHSSFAAFHWIACSGIFLFEKIPPERPLGESQFPLYVLAGNVGSGAGARAKTQALLY